MGTASCMCVRPDFIMSWNSLPFGLKGRSQRVEHGIEFFQLQQSGHAHGGGKNVIGGLAIIHVIIGMDTVYSPSLPPSSSVARLAMTSLEFM